VFGWEVGRAVLRVDSRKGFSSSLPLLSGGGLVKVGTSQRLDSAPAVPLIARDTFVAETATKIDQLQGTVQLLVRDVNALVAKVSGLEDVSDVEHRWYAFQQNAKSAREAKLDEMLRRCQDLKARLDRMDARSNGNYHAYTSFEAVSRKLAELEHFRDEAQRVERKVTLRAWLFCSALALATTIIVVSNVISG
jgi:hypothetical protein